MQAAGPQLQLVANVAVGYDNIDVPAASRHGILDHEHARRADRRHRRSRDRADAVVTRRLAEGERLIRARQDWRWNMFMMLGTGIQGKTLGIVGLGAIGQAIARRARAFGMEIVYSQRNRAAAEVERRSTARATYRSMSFSLTADVVSLHCPLTPETRHLIDGAALATMKPTAFLVNTARGPVVDEAALAHRVARRRHRRRRARRVRARARGRRGSDPARQRRARPASRAPRRSRRATRWPASAASNVVAALAAEPAPTPVNACSAGNPARSPALLSYPEVREDPPPCQQILSSSSAGITPRMRRRRCRFSRRRWTLAARSPMRIAVARRRHSGLPEAAVYGISTFYDDLLQPRGKRPTSASAPAPPASRRPATPTSARSRSAFGLELGERSEDGSVSLAETVCLGFCHASPAVRDGDVIDAGPDLVARVLAGETRPAPEPDWAACWRAGPHAARGLVGPGSRYCRARARGAPRGGEGGRRPGSRWRRLPGRRKWEFARSAPRRAEVHRRQRRRGRPGLLHRQVPDGAQPGARARGDGARRIRGRRLARLHPRAAASTRLSSRRSRRPPRTPRAAGWLGENIARHGLRSST